MTINQTQLNQYFATTWRERDRSIAQYQYTGFELVKQIASGESVIDVGCGTNPFVDLIPNIIGIDPAFPEATHQVSLEDYVSNYPNAGYDVAFCLGSINFGTVDDIEHQIRLLTQILKANSRIYWRCNPGRRDHGNEECNSVPFYAWSFDEHYRLAEKFGYSVAELAWDTNNRIYSQWRKHSAV